MITKLKGYQVIVVGTNLAGNHAGEAAKQAKEDFGLQEGVAEGMSGQTYAFPTLTKDFKQRDHHDLKNSVKNFWHCAIEHPEVEFLMTPVGTGIAGYDTHYMKSLFQDMPKNVVLPPEWT